MKDRISNALAVANVQDGAVLCLSNQEHLEPQQHIHPNDARAKAFDDLLKLDTIRSRMAAVKRALEEADSWNTLTSELDAIFAGGGDASEERAGTRLAEAARSLVLLHNTPEYEERVSSFNAILINIHTTVFF